MYIINPTSGKEIPNSYPTSSSTGSNSSNSSSSNSIINNASSHQQEIISKILTKCATMTDEVAASGTTAATTVNGTATILLSPSHHHPHHHPSLPAGVSPQSSPASSSSSASSPTADGPQQLHASFGATGREKTPASGKPGGSGTASGQNGTTAASSAGLSFGGDGPGSKHTHGTGSGGKVNGNGTATVSATNASGGRLQFFKDGKFILELARAREGEKTSWISVPRKTFWPPTVSSTSANFHKHESSTSLSFSDDNSSIQSSPWQRDHCWKQTNPRPNISKEMALYYHRPSCVRFKLSRDVLKRLRLKRRRPYEPHNSTEGGAGGVALNYEIIRDRQLPPPDEAEDDAMDLKVNGKVGENSTNEEDQSNGRSKTSNGLGTANGTRDFNVRRFRGMLKRRKELDLIVQHLKIRVATNVSNTTPRVPTAAGLRSVFNSSHQQHVSPRKRILRELEKVSLEDSSTMKRSRPKPGSNSTVITATTATPLAPVTSNGTGASESCAGNNSSTNSANITGNNSNNSNGKLTNGLSAMPLAVEPRHTATIPTTPVSRPISSYSINSLLGHNSSSESSNRPKQLETNPTTSHHPYQHPHSSHYQYLGKDVIAAPKSPSDTHLSQRYYGKKKSPSYGTQSAASPSSATEFGVGYGMVRSPDLSPSPEHQTHSSFTRYRQHPYSIHPTVSSPSSSYSTVSRCSPSPSTNDSASSPYSSNAKYRAAYLASSGSPPSSTATASGSANSPQHYSRHSPLNFARSPPPTHQSGYLPNNSYRVAGAKDSPSSPRASPNVESVQGATTTPTSSSSSTPSIRTVPKKTAALRQQFGSPSSSPSTIDQAKRERSNSNASSTSSEVSRNAHYKKELEYAERSAPSSDVVDGHPAATSTVIRPSTVIASPTPHHAAMANPFYMYPPQIAASLIAAQQSSAVPFLPASPLTSYYQHMYNQAAVAAAYRNPLWMHYQSLSPHAAAAAAAAAAVSPPSGAPPPLVPSSSSPAGQPSNNRDAQQRDSSRTHSANNTTSSNSSSPSPTISAMNYSASVLASSPHHVHPHQQLQHRQHPRLSSPWRVPVSSSSSSSSSALSATPSALMHDPAAGQTPPSLAASSASGALVGMKEDPGADVPLNLSKH